MAVLRYALITIVLSLIYMPTHESQSQGRLIFAPPHYVQHNMFDVDFWTSILPDSGKDSFFYPAHIRKQLHNPSAREHNAAKYAEAMASKHADMGSDVAIDPKTVVRLVASKGHYWTGQKMTYQFDFSARTVEGENGTQTVFEYTTTWHSPVVLYFLHKKDVLPRRWSEIKQVEDIDSAGIDLFRVEVEKAWERLGQHL